jgi:hypothetical protein
MKQFENLTLQQGSHERMQFGILPLQQGNSRRVHAVGILLLQVTAERLYAEKLPILKRAWSANFKMVWYVLLRPLRPELDLSKVSGHFK